MGIQRIIDNVRSIKKLIQTKQENLQRQKDQHKFKQQSYKNFVTDKVSFTNILKSNKDNNNIVNSFADLLNPRENEVQSTNSYTPKNSNGKKPTSQNNETHLNFLNIECNEYFGMNFMEIIKQINYFIPKYKSIVDTNQKCESLLSFMFNLMVKNG